ncbi:class I SAM-dependent methyltransferase [Sandarakinorhabdus sp.]|uniref:class I SAM-dependent methyltransferase n=1 Tax=Sandarakinorhabdus sp. TaxID=1916663 RepID=UPI00334244F4
MTAAVQAVQPSVAAGIDGYVDDEAYPSGLDQRFTPAWIDAILAQRGLAAPRQPRGPFTYVDLGCGDGVGLILLAAAHPEARFAGIDALADHVARGRALAAAIGLTNVSFQCATFEAADGIACGTADYVALRGVVTWVSTAAAGAALDLAAHLLRPGGTLAIGYNILPAWSPLIPFQRLIFDRAAALPGTGSQRFEAALAQLRAEGLIAQAVLDWLDAKRETLPAGYFPHEYLNRHWAPIWSGDLIAAMDGRGLRFAGNADPGRQRPEFLLRTAQRQALAAMADTGAREIATDTYLNCPFRTDYFLKADVPARADKAAIVPDRLRQVWTGHARADTATYAFTTAMGRIGFDNPAARAILCHLETGPGRLDTITGISAADLLNTLDALWLAGLVTPAEPPAIVPHSERTNQIVAAATAAAPLGLMVGAHGIIAG